LYTGNYFVDIKKLPIMLKISTLLLIILILPLAVLGQSTDWISQTGGDFHNPANWDGAAVPHPSNSVRFALGTSYVITASSPIVTNSAHMRNGIIRLHHPGKTWTTQSGSTFYIGEQDATLNLTAGKLYLRTTHIGVDPQSVGKLFVTGAESEIETSWGTLFTIGHRGTGVVKVTDGAKANIGLHTHLGYYGGSKGSLHVAGTNSAWTSPGQIVMGIGGDADVLVSDGAQMHGQQIYIGNTVSSNSALNVTGKNSLVSSIFKVSAGHGAGSRGEITIDEGGHVTSTWGILGELQNTKGVAQVRGDDSRWDMQGFYAGFRGEGNMTVSEGGTLTSLWGRVGVYEGANGIVTIEGEDSSWQNTNEVRIGVHEGSKGRLNIINGGVFSAEILDIKAQGGVGIHGVIEAEVINNGTFEGDKSQQHPSSMVVQGKYTQQQDGHLFLRVFSKQTGLSSDTLTVMGIANLSGNLFLSVHHARMIKPQGCVSLLDAENIIGTFSNVGLIGSSQPWFMTINETSASLCFRDTNACLLNSYANDIGQRCYHGNYLSPTSRQR